MPALLEVLEREHNMRGLADWLIGSAALKPNGMASLPANLPVWQRPTTIRSGNLICLQEIRDDCTD